MGDGGLGDAQKGGNVADAHLRGKKHIENAHPRGIAEDMKEFCEIIKSVFIWHLLAHAVENFFMGGDQVAAFHIRLVHIITCSYDYLFIYYYTQTEIFVNREERK